MLLPCDYVASLFLTWQGETFALGDLILFQDGAPVFRDRCKNQITNVCALGIGYIVPNGFCGHIPGINYEVHEIVMSFSVNENKEATFVRYTVVCHDSIGLGINMCGGRNAADFIADQGESLRTQRITTDGYPDIYIEVYTSYAEMVLFCTEQISKGIVRPCMGCDFTPCFTPCFTLWHGVRDPGQNPSGDCPDCSLQNFFAPPHARLF